MPRLEDDEETYYALRRVPGRFYFSKRFPEGGSESAESEQELRNCRFAYQVFDSSGEVEFSSDHGWELLIRETPSRQQLKALFFEDQRHIKSLVFQRFNKDGDALKRESFVLTDHEVEELAAFLALIRSSSLKLDESEDGLRLLPSGIDALLADESSRITLYQRYRDLFVDLFSNDIDSPEVIAYARRKKELDRFNELLTDESAFQGQMEELKAQGRRGGQESVWQDFFESNKWIFGSGLAAQFLHSWNPVKLEQAVAGHSVFGPGKRPDGLMRTAGALSALVLVEIKGHGTPLLEKNSYRSGAWQISSEVSGGVSQCQATVDATVKQAQGELHSRDDDDFRTGETTFVCRPRSILVVGSLDQFIKDDQISTGRFESFERFRRSLSDPEIITFDELYERARMVLDITGAERPERLEPTSDERDVPF